MASTLFSCSGIHPPSRDESIIGERVGVTPWGAHAVVSSNLFLRVFPQGIPYPPCPTPLSDLKTHLHDPDRRFIHDLISMVQNGDARAIVKNASSSSKHQQSPSSFVIHHQILHASRCPRPSRLQYARSLEDFSGLCYRTNVIRGFKAHVPARQSKVNE